MLKNIKIFGKKSFVISYPTKLTKIKIYEDELRWEH